MTRFTVIWDTQAEDELAEIWIQSGVRKSVTDAADEINVMLRFDPQSKGRNLAEGLRALDVGPLQAIFTVSLPDRIAQVVLVKLTRR
jgi:hypothetical protein